MINYRKSNVFVNKGKTAMLSLLSVTLCLLLAGCAGSASPSDSTPTPVPDQDYQYTFSVTELDGKYYEFPDCNKNYGIIKPEDEQTILPELIELGSTTRTATSQDYPDKNRQSNCLPEGIRIFYNEKEDKYAFFDDQKEGYWRYSGVYKVYDKSEMNADKTYYSFEYTDHVRYSGGWVEEQYESATKVLGFVTALFGQEITIAPAVENGGTFTATGEASTYKCSQPDLFSLYEDTKLYKKAHVSSIGDLDLNTPYYFCIKADQVTGIVEAR